MEGIWKDIPGYEGLYQVSNLGRVKSLDRISRQNHKIKSKIIVNVTNGSGYNVVSLYGMNKKSFKVHQLVAIAFLNHTPCGYKLVVNHIDFDKSNNRADNLEIVTNRENSNKKHLKSTSKYTGVSYNKSWGRWVAHIIINGKKEYLGGFKNEIDAHNAYQNKLEDLVLKS